MIFCVWRIEKWVRKLLLGTHVKNLGLLTPEYCASEELKKWYRIVVLEASIEKNRGRSHEVSHYNEVTIENMIPGRVVLDSMLKMANVHLSLRLRNWEMISWFSCPFEAVKKWRIFTWVWVWGIALILLLRTVCPQQAVEKWQDLETWGLLSRRYLRNR